jgi:hypothetical protein
VIPGILAASVAGVLLVGGAVAGIVSSRRRREALEHYCLTRGYRFEAERPGGETALEEGFRLFERGRHRRWGPTITGRIGGAAFTAFEYSYVTGGGNSTRRHRFTVVLWDLGEGAVPNFTLEPEGVLNRLAQHFGTQDFDFLEDPVFSRFYELQGDDEAAVRRLFTPVRRAYLTTPSPGGDRPLAHHLAGAGAHLLWWRSGRLPRAEALDQLLADADRLRRVLVDF